jgi:bifunctional non-homologous end joining protein LigD
MRLQRYHRKRDFRKTPEPRGKIAEHANGKLSFVVHKHAARRLHYDFRLEMDGVLSS